MVRLALDLGADADLRAKGSYRTPLMMAAETGDCDIAALLTARGAAVDKPGRNGATALMTAVCNDRVEMVAFLAAAGADVNRRNDDGMTAMSYADEFSAIEDILLQAIAAQDERELAQSEVEKARQAGAALHAVAATRQRNLRRGMPKISLKRGP